MIPVRLGRIILPVSGKRQGPLILGWLHLNRCFREKPELARLIHFEFTAAHALGGAALPAFIFGLCLAARGRSGFTSGGNKKYCLGCRSHLPLEKGLSGAMIEEPQKELAEGPRASGESSRNGSGSLSATTASFGRRAFLGQIGFSTVAAATSVGLPASLSPEDAQAEEIGPVGDQRRRNEALRARLRTALAERRAPLPQHPTNGDEELYANKIG